MIPRKIHYCWFGGKDIPISLKKYIDTWEKYCPNYEIILWDESRFDVNSHIFTKSAYLQKKYAYVSDYVRAYALYNYGGIYLDTDVEVKKNLDEFLSSQAFTGFEGPGFPFTAVWGCEKGHILAADVLEFYNDKIYNVGFNTNTALVSDILINDFDIDPKCNAIQRGVNKQGTIDIYPAEFFCLDTPASYTTHHFYGSWVDKQETPYKELLHIKYYYHNLKNLSKLSKENKFLILKSISNDIKLNDLFKMLIFYSYYNFIPKFIKRKIRILYK